MRRKDDPHQGPGLESVRSQVAWNGWEHMNVALTAARTGPRCWRVYGQRTTGIRSRSSSAAACESIVQRCAAMSLGAVVRRVPGRQSVEGVQSSVERGDGSMQLPWV